MRVFITGASSGIGAALARHYARRGATLGLLARREAALTALREDLPSPTSGTHQIYAADVTVRAQLESAALDFMRSQGTPDIVIANAGISSGTLTEYAGDVVAFEQIVRTNLLAMVFTFQPFITPMRALHKARLVGIGSVAGVRGLRGAGAYSASKAAVACYCESLRIELRDSPIRVVTIAPGYIATPMTARNPYPMPFLMPAERFAEKAARAIDRGTSYAVIPWPMAFLAKLLRLMPNSLYDLAMAHAPSKPRRPAD